MIHLTYSLGPLVYPPGLFLTPMSVLEPPGSFPVPTSVLDPPLFGPSVNVRAWAGHAWFIPGGILLTTPKE